MPRSELALRTERDAIAIVRAEYELAGWIVGPALSKVEERRQGCDLVAEHPDTGERLWIEVKGWGEPFLGARGGFNYPADINAQQHGRAVDDDRWRLEIVANLAAARAGSGQPQRLTLSAQAVRQRAIPLKLAIPLDGLERQIREVTPTPTDRAGPENPVSRRMPEPG